MKYLAALIIALPFLLLIVVMWDSKPSGLDNGDDSNSSLPGEGKL